MKEKYESLSLATLKDLAKARGLKGISTMRKPELIERMLEEDKKEQTAENEQTISGTATSLICFAPSSIAAQFFATTSSPLRPYVALAAAFIRSIACSSGMIPVSLKNAD